MHRTAKANDRFSARHTRIMISVLLADDHPAMRAGVKQSLDADPDISVVAVAADGTEALRLARDLSPDVAILDVDMPGLSGIEVARALQGLPVRVIALTAFSGRGFVRGLLAAGAAGYVTKDVPEHVLIDAVKAVAAGGGHWTVVPHDPEDPLAVLSEREQDILSLLARGLSNPAIAETLFVSESTVRNTLTTVYEKTGTTTRGEAIAWAWTRGLGTPIT